MLSDLYIRAIKIKKEIVENEDYVSNLQIVKNLLKQEQLAFSKVNFLVGENGTGKSTLLEALAVANGFNAEGGTKNFNFSTESTHSELHQYVTVVKGVKKPADGFFFRAESFYNVASEINRLDKIAAPLLPAYGGKSLHAQSHGESFLSLVLNRFRGNGVYILDEPEAALSPARQMSFLAAMDALVKQNSQFIIATHSPILLAFPGATIYVLTEEGIQQTPYEETDHYRLTKQFLNNPEGMLRHLLEDPI